MSTRKKWSTTRDNLARTHRSKRAAYDWIAKLAGDLRAGLPLSSTVVQVWVDEGRGWERYERVDLREHAAFTVGQ